MSYEKIFDLVTKVDDFVWGPAMLVLLVGTGIFLTIRVGFLTWRNLGYAIKSTLSKEARTQKRGDGDVSLPSVPAISWVLQQPWYPAVPAPLSGCGFPPVSV